MQGVDGNTLKYSIQRWAEPLAFSTLGILLMALEVGSASADWVLNIVGTMILAILMFAGMITVAKKI